MSAEPPLFDRMVGEFNPASVGDPLNELLPFKKCQTSVDARGLLREFVVREVAALRGLLEQVDAFDVIELLRMAEFGLAPGLPSAFEGGSALHIDIVAAILLARGSRQPEKRADMHQAAAVIPELHSRCATLARVASYRILTEGSLRGEGRLSRLASEYQSAVLNIRNLGYDHIRDAHDRALFEIPAVQVIMRRHLGFDYADVLAVRTAMQSLSTERFTRLRDDSGDLLERFPHSDPSELPTEVGEEFMASIIPMMFAPGTRAAITSEDVARAGGTEVGVAEAVLESFSQAFDADTSAEDRVFSLLTGNNPFLSKPLLADGRGSFAVTSGDIGLDVLRRILEHSLTGNSPDTRRYDKGGRQQMSESFAIQYIETILGSPPASVGYFYWWPKADVPVDVLGASCSDLSRNGDRVEGDALFVVDDVAVVVEVKGKSVADQARRGDVRRLRTDLKATIGDGAKQTARVQRLIETNGGFWDESGSWCDLSSVREVRSIVVMLDDVGPLGANLEDLHRAGLVQAEQPPLVLSLHDLAVIAEIGERPAEFLLYLRRRTDSPVRAHYRAVDELDLYMLFLSADLYIEDDPDELKRKFPTMPPVTARQRRKFESIGVGTLVSDNCEELDAWMIRTALPIDMAPTKPRMQAPEGLLALVDQIADRGDAGWLRCGADLLALSGSSQDQVVNLLDDSARRARHDGEHHNCFMSLAGLWGHPSIFIGARPPASTPDEASRRLRIYAEVKQYQFQSDRAYGFLADSQGNLETTFYLAAPPAQDTRLDRLVAEMRLQPAGRRTSPVPPSARRQTKRLRGKKPRK